MTGRNGKMRETDYLGHMLEAVRLARSYCEGIEQADFLMDRKTQQAVIFNLLVIGEAATKICNDYPAFTLRYPGFPWKPMRGMRNRLAHGYFEIDLAVVWDTVQAALPDLERQLVEIIR